MTYKHNSLFVFDIETIPDTEAVPHLVDDVGESLEERREALTQYHLGLTHGKKSFSRQLFHRVVAISFLSAQIHRDGTYESYRLQDLRSAGMIESSEPDLIVGL